MCDVCKALAACTNSLKSFEAAPWYDIDSRFLFYKEEVYPTDHDFIFPEFLDF